MISLTCDMILLLFIDVYVLTVDVDFAFDFQEISKKLARLGDFCLSLHCLHLSTSSAAVMMQSKFIDKVNYDLDCVQSAFSVKIRLDLISASMIANHDVTLQ